MYHIYVSYIYDIYIYDTYIYVSETVGLKYSVTLQRLVQEKITTLPASPHFLAWRSVRDLDFSITPDMTIWDLACCFHTVMFVWLANRQNFRAVSQCTGQVWSMKPRRCRIECCSLEQISLHLCVSCLHKNISGMARDPILVLFVCCYELQWFLNM